MSSFFVLRKRRKALPIKTAQAKPSGSEPQVSGLVFQDARDRIDGQDYRYFGVNSDHQLDEKVQAVGRRNAKNG